MAMIQGVSILFPVLLTLQVLSAAWTVETLAEFERPPGQAQSPLTLHSDGHFYGTSAAGGWEDLGTIYRMTSEGMLTTLHSFSQTDGSGPVAALVEGADGALFGTTSAGGAHGFGTVFRYSIGGMLTTLVDFTGPTGPAKGSVPGGLIRHSNGNFYGVTAGGGASGLGTAFQMNPDGEVTTLVEFTGSAGTRPGSRPVGKLTPIENDLFGVTEAGGASGLGALFKLSTTGTWTSLGSFTGTAGARPGEAPAGGLVLHGDGNLYGTAEFGGTNGLGTSFRLTPAGAFTTLFHFSDPLGGQPAGALLEGIDGALYGLTSTGGAFDWGTAYRLTTAGDHAVRAHLTGKEGALPGAFPQAGFVTGADNQLYAPVGSGGPGNLGTVFKMSTAGASTLLATFSGVTGWAPGGAPVGDGEGGVFFPLAAGGTGGGGTLGSWTAGGGFSVAASLGGSLGEGPDGALVEEGGTFYGVSSSGGASGRGTAFQFNPGSGLSLVADYSLFSGSAAEGHLLPTSTPGLFVGVAREGGASGLGTLYALGTGGTRTRLVSFTGTSGSAPGASPRGPLAALPSFTRYYGVTEAGGANGTGVIFRLSAAGTYLKISDLGSTGARVPQGGLVHAPDGFVYGTTAFGGTEDAGTIIRIDPADESWTVVASFTGLTGTAPGRRPLGELSVDATGRIYGLTASGGAADAGVVFRYQPGEQLETLVELTGTGGAAPGAGSIQLGGSPEYSGGVYIDPMDNSLLVLAAGGGSGGGGTLLRLTEGGSSPLSNWKLTHLGDAFANDMDDPDEDGIVNLMEYALGLNPVLSDANSGPTLELTSTPGGQRACLTIPRDPSHADITVVIETSNDLLEDWSPLATSTGGAPFVGPGIVGADPDTPVIRLVEICEPEVPSPTGKRFFRIRVVHN